MSLFEEIGTTCTLLDRRRKPDGEGGYITVWENGVSFMNRAALDTSMQARVAEAQGVTSVYTAIVNDDVPIEYGDYYRDESTGKTFRVTSNPDEKKTPAMASEMLKGLKSFTAERKELPQ